MKIGDSEQQLHVSTGTYTNIEDLLSVINETLKNAKHQDIQFSYSRLSSRVSVPERKTCTLKTDSPGLVLGIGEIAAKHDITGSYTFPFAVDLSKGRRFVLLYTDLIGPSVEYEDNEDSRVLKTLSNDKVVQNSILERTEKKVSLLEGRQSVTLYSKSGTPPSLNHELDISSPNFIALGESYFIVKLKYTVKTT